MPAFLCGFETGPHRNLCDSTNPMLEIERGFAR